MDWPKCEHEFTSDSGTAKCEGGRIIFYGIRGGRIELNPCPACNGTGWAKELTEDQAGDFLKSVYGEDWYLRPDGYKYAVIYDGDVRIGEGRNIREALTTAALTARAIKEKEKK